MFYILNGKKVKRSDVIKALGAMVRFVDVAVFDAIEEGREIPVFNTTLGPLVVKVK